MSALRFFLPALALIAALQAAAQNQAPIRTDSAFLHQPLQPFTGAPAPAAPVLHGNVVRALDARLEQGHLNIHYTLYKQDLADLQYRVTVRLRIGDKGAFAEPDIALLRGHWGAVSPTANGEYVLSVLDFVERYPYFEVVEVHLLVQTFGSLPFDCAKPPQYGLKQSLPLIAGATGGVVIAGVGLLLYTRSKDQYDQYKADAAAADADQLYRDANNNHKTGVALMEAGGVVVLGSVTYHIVQRLRFKHKQRQFREFCREYAPDPVPQLGLSDAGAGLKLQFTF